MGSTEVHARPVSAGEIHVRRAAIPYPGVAAHARSFRHRPSARRPIRLKSIRPSALINSAATNRRAATHRRGVTCCHRSPTVRPNGAVRAHATQIGTRRCRAIGSEISGCRPAVESTLLCTWWPVRVVAAIRTASAIPGRARRVRRTRTVIPRVRSSRRGHTRVAAICGRAVTTVASVTRIR